MKGRRVGGAEVAARHANFLVNTGGATAADLLALMALVQGEVKAQFDVLLEPEVVIVGS